MRASVPPETTPATSPILPPKAADIAVLFGRCFAAVSPILQGLSNAPALHPPCRTADFPKILFSPLVSLPFRCFPHSTKKSGDVRQKLCYTNARFI